jgi:hypothetical protein
MQPIILTIPRHRTYSIQTQSNIQQTSLRYSHVVFPLPRPSKGICLMARSTAILSRVYGTWQPITRVLGPNEWVYWTNELHKYHTTKCNTHFWIFFYSQLVILGRWLLTWVTWFLPRLTLSIAVCQLALLSFYWPLLIAPLLRYCERFY